MKKKMRIEKILFTSLMVAAIQVASNTTYASEGGDSVKGEIIKAESLLHKFRENNPRASAFGGAFGSDTYTYASKADCEELRAEMDRIEDLMDSPELNLDDEARLLSVGTAINATVDISCKP